jgi:hypothetical protein
MCALSTENWRVPASQAARLVILAANGPVVFEFGCHSASARRKIILKELGIRRMSVLVEPPFKKGAAQCAGRFSSLFAVVGLAIVAVAPGQPHAVNLTSLVSFCALANCADGEIPSGGPIGDADRGIYSGGDPVDVAQDLGAASRASKCI